MIESGTVETKIENGIGNILFGHPQSNSLPGKLLKKIASEITSLGNNKEVKVIVLRTQGEKTFCAGASFDELISIKDFETGKDFFSGFAMVINAIRTVPKFVIGRVQGKAVGGGVGIAAALDYAIAHSSASVKLSELAVGIGPFVVGPAVERKIGSSAFSELTINATEWKSAAWAREKGLYTEVFDDLAQVDIELQKLAEKLAASNPEAMQMLKKIMWKGTKSWDKLLIKRAEMSGKLVLSEFTVNSINSFKTGAR